MCVCVLVINSGDTNLHILIWYGSVRVLFIKLDKTENGVNGRRYFRERENLFFFVQFRFSDFVRC